MKIFFGFAVFIGLHCGNATLYDEAITNYARVVRSGLNEWYPLNGNLSSRLGSADGTAMSTYSAGANRAGESGKVVCTTSAEFLFTPTNFGASPFTISAWIKLNTLTTGPNSLIQKGQQQTGYKGFIISQNSTSTWPMAFGNASNTQNASATGVAANAWFFFSFTYDGSTGVFYMGEYNKNLIKVGSITAAYVQDTSQLQIFAPAGAPPGPYGVSSVDGCADDILGYNRALTNDEVKQNFQSLE